MFEVDTIIGPYRNEDGSEWVRVVLLAEWTDPPSEATVRTLVTVPVRVLSDTTVLGLQTAAIERAKVELAKLIT